MAIHPSFPGLEAVIEVDGKPAKEYEDDPSSDEKCVKRFVEAKTGATFVVNVRFNHAFPKNHSVRLRLFVDGVLIEHHILSPQTLHERPSHSYSGVKSRMQDAHFIRKFKFSSLQSIENDEETVTEEERRQLASVGKITLKLYFCTITHTRLSKHRDKEGVKKHVVTTYNEKAAKGNVLSHMVSLGEMREMPERKRKRIYKIHGTKDVGDGQPFAVFDFHYRSMEALKSMHIIPPTPEPRNPMDIDQTDLQTLDRGDLERMVLDLQRKNRTAQSSTRQLIKTERPSSVETEQHANTADNDNNVDPARSQLARQSIIGREYIQDGKVIIELD